MSFRVPNVWSDDQPLPTKRLETVPEVVKVKIADIELGNAGRKINKRKVAQLKRSIRDQGIRQPVQLYRLKNGKYGLAAGQHRLRALIELGYEDVPATILGSREEAFLWRASENLHRSDLTELQRSRAIVEYAKAREPVVKPPSKKRGGKQPHDKGYSDLARLLKFDQKRIAEAYRHVELPKAIQKRVEGDRRLDKRRVLNELVVCDDEAMQAELLDKRAQRKSKANGKSIFKKTGPVRKAKAKEVAKFDKRAKQLLTRWEKSSFKKRFDKENRNTRRAFLAMILKNL